MSKHSTPLLYYGTVSLGVVCLLFLFGLAIHVILTDPQFGWIAVPAIALFIFLCGYGVYFMIRLVFPRHPSRREQHRLILLQEFHHLGTSEVRRKQIAKDPDFKLDSWD